jgi:hypothetical protein
VAKLALDDDQRHALPRELERVRVAQLVRSEATPGRRGQVLARAGAVSGLSTVTARMVG